MTGKDAFDIAGVRLAVVNGIRKLTEIRTEIDDEIKSLRLILGPLDDLYEKIYEEANRE